MKARPFPCLVVERGQRGALGMRARVGGAEQGDGVGVEADGEEGKSYSVGSACR